MTEVTVVGPIRRETGGIAQYMTEQVNHFDALTIRTHDIASSEGSGVLWLLYTILGALVDAVRFTSRRRSDIVHVHTSHRFSFLRASFYVLFTKYVWRRPVVLHVHGSSFDEFARTDSRFLSWYQGIVFGASCRIIVLSSYWKDVLTERVGTKKVEVVPNSINPDDYEPEWNKSSPHVVFISNLIERKGVNELITAIKNVDGICDYRVTIAGKGPLSETVSALAEEYEHVQYLGYISEEEKRSTLESGTIYVLPSYAEGLPIAILEGMAAGNAVISTDVGAIPEVVTKNGITVAPGDTTELEDAIRKLLLDTERAIAMGQESRKMAKTNYSWDYTTDRLKNIYEDCISEP